MFVRKRKKKKKEQFIILHKGDLKPNKKTRKEQNRKKIKKRFLTTQNETTKNFLKSTKE